MAHSDTWPVTLDVVWHVWHCNCCIWPSPWIGNIMKIIICLLFDPYTFPSFFLPHFCFFPFLFFLSFFVFILCLFLPFALYISSSFPFFICHFSPCSPYFFHIVCWFLRFCSVSMPFISRYLLSLLPFHRTPVPVRIPTFVPFSVFQFSRPSSFWPPSIFPTFVS